MTNINPIASSQLKSNNTNNKHSLKTRNVVGASVGTLIGAAPIAFLIKEATKIPTPESIEATKPLMELNFPPIDTFENTKNIANKILKEKGLADKGVELFIADNSPSSRVSLDKLFEKETPKKMVNAMKEVLHNGLNACFVAKYNKVIINDKRAHSAVFHEIGHAMNFNGNIFVKALQKARVITPMNVSLLAPIGLAVSMLHKVDKTKPQSEKSKTEKSLDFVSNNAGKLTLASYIPLVTEEFLASHRGIKVAKKHLNPEQISKLVKSYRMAGSTYLGAALAVSGAVGLATIVKNKIARPNQKAANA